MKKIWRGLAVLGAVVLVVEAIAACGPAQPGLTKDTENPVSWQTPNVSLTADDFWIEADGRRFTAQDAVVGVRGDPGDSRRTTLELTWQEMDREMRLFIYFTADGDHWCAHEIRTYDGQVEGEWLGYRGTSFKTPLGRSFEGNVDLPTSRKRDRTDGHLHFKNLRLSPRFRDDSNRVRVSAPVQIFTDANGTTYVMPEGLDLDAAFPRSDFPDGPPPGLRPVTPRPPPDCD